MANDQLRVFRRPRQQWDSVEWWALILIGCFAVSAALITLGLTGVLNG